MNAMAPIAANHPKAARWSIALPRLSDVYTMYVDALPPVIYECKINLSAG
jgi:hypothetical protein